VSFVNHSHAERNLADNVEVADQSVVRRDEDIELQKLGSVRTILVIPLVLSKYVSPDALPVVVDATLQVGPGFELPAPVLNGRQRDNNKIRAPYLLDTKQMFDVAHDLHGLEEEREQT
jgi:hypothetical protein